MPLDVERERLIRKDLREYVLAYRDIIRLSLGVEKLKTEYYKANELLQLSFKRQDEAQDSLDYRVSGLDPEVDSEIQSITKEYMADLTDIPTPDEVVKVVWLNSLGGIDDSQDTAQVQENSVAEASE